jgi:hypothetical protein
LHLSLFFQVFNSKDVNQIKRINFPLSAAFLYSLFSAVLISSVSSSLNLHMVSKLSSYGIHEMKVEASFSQIAPPVFNVENYRFWIVKMETYQEALDLWKAMEEDYEVHSLPNNPTMAQSRSHKERKTRKSKAIASLFDVVMLFHENHVSLNNKRSLDYLKEESAEDERIGDLQVLNLIREFKLQKIKEFETIKEYLRQIAWHCQQGKVTWQQNLLILEL